MFTEKKLHTNERGISLLIVLLVGTIMLFTSLAIGQYALRMVTSIRARSEATQTLYTAEQAFECVKYWLNKDYRHFSNIGGGLTAECNGTAFDFAANTDTAADGFSPSYNAGTGVGTFRIPYNSADPTRGGVVVEVERSDPSLQLFDGLVRVYSQSDAETAYKTSERFQEYHYRVLYGADIMFVVDRSGSIEDGGDRTVSGRSNNNEWNDMLDAVDDSIRLLNLKVPAPLMGIVSFGSDAYDTGQVAADCSVAGCNWREADQKLTGNINDLIDDSGTAGDLTDDFPNMELAKASTNLSLGISIAGAELMGKYYPHTGIANPVLTAGFGVGEFSGEFERIVADQVPNGFDLLPDQDSPMDRPDAEFPDVIVVLTDGAPNGIMTHRRSALWIQSAITNPSDPEPLRFIFGVPYIYEIGEAKLFRTSTGGAGPMVVDDPTDFVSTAPLPPPCHAYIYCNDNATVAPVQKPSDVFINPIDTDVYPHMAMCNATLIADKFKADEGTIFIVVYVGNDDTTDEAFWLREYLASKTVDGDPLFAMIDDYTGLRDALLYLFEQLDFLKTR